MGSPDRGWRIFIGVVSNDYSGQPLALARARSTWTVRTRRRRCRPQVARAVVHDRNDLGFFAIDPQRGVEIALTPPYVLIEGCYLVRADSPLHADQEVDRAGHVVVVGQASAYDLHLTRALQHATIVRAPTSQTVVQTSLERRADVAAGVRQQLEADARKVSGSRLLGEEGSW